MNACRPEEMVSLVPPVEPVIHPGLHPGAFRDLAGPGVPKPAAWELEYTPERAISCATVRESGAALYGRAGIPLWDLHAYQRSNNHFGVFPWNLGITVERGSSGRFVIRGVRLSETVKGARGERCLRDYLYLQLVSYLVGRTFDASLLPLISPLRLQCTHVVELVRYALGLFLHASAEGLLTPVAGSAGEQLLYAKSEITQVTRVQEGDVFWYAGIQEDHVPGETAGKRFQYQFSIPAIQSSLRVREDGWVEITRLLCAFQGTVNGTPFQAAKEVSDARALDDFVVDALQGLVSPSLVLSGNLKDITTFLKLLPTLRYPFGKGFNREFYEKIFRKNSFCIGWRPELIHKRVL